MAKDKMKKNDVQPPHYLCGSRLHNLLLLIRENGFRIVNRKVPTFMGITMFNLLMSPIAAIEKAMIRRKIKHLQLEKDPVFILGHWRSGTTFLINTMSRDRQFCFFNVVNIMMPNIFMSMGPLINRFAKRIMPKKRPMDNMDLELDLPQEEDYAVANMVPYSITHMTSFPENSELYMEYGLQDNLTKEQFDEWQETYQYLLKKVTLQHNGKQLLLKSPINTGRIKVLLDMYPNAKFVHIYRNPRKVFMSTRKLYDTVFPLYSLQDAQAPDDDVASFQFKLYKRLYGKYLKQKHLIPEGNLVEVRYEDFAEKPLETVEHIYQAIGIDGFEDAKDDIAAYLATLKSYKKNVHSKMKPDEKKRVEKEMDFAIEQWGYKES